MFYEKDLHKLIKTNYEYTKVNMINKEKRFVNKFIYLI